MSNVLALIPARSGSKGIPGKNRQRFTIGLSPVMLAIRCARTADIQACWVTTDDDVVARQAGDSCYAGTIRRPAELAQDYTPMIDVVKHALVTISGLQDQIVVLLEPTQPLRKPEHVKAAITLLETLRGVDSVVSVVDLPLAQSPELLLVFSDSCGLKPWQGTWDEMPTQRQSARRAYMRDGTVYVFRRETVTRYSNIYGGSVFPLVIPRKETCALDTRSDWQEAEKRLRELEVAR